MRCFEKISFEQFKKDVKDDLDLYNSYDLPKRSTKNSAGYDFEAINDFTIMPNEVVKIPLGIKVMMNEDEVLFILVRSSMGFKYNVRLVNQVGVIDSDYYGSDNEGHIQIKITNDSREGKALQIKAGDAFAQGVFTEYGITEDDDVKSKRNGGFGSTSQ